MSKERDAIIDEIIAKMRTHPKGDRDADAATILSIAYDVAAEMIAEARSGKDDRLDRLMLAERRVTASMEQDVKKYGEFQADWHGAMREIEAERAAIAKAEACDA